MKSFVLNRAAFVRSWPSLEIAVSGATPSRNKQRIPKSNARVKLLAYYCRSSASVYRVVPRVATCSQLRGRLISSRVSRVDRAMPRRAAQIESHQKRKKGKKRRGSRREGGDSRPWRREGNERSSRFLHRVAGGANSSPAVARGGVRSAGAAKFSIPAAGRQQNPASRLSQRN